MKNQDTKNMKNQDTKNETTWRADVTFTRATTPLRDLTHPFDGEELPPVLASAYDLQKILHQMTEKIANIGTMVEAISDQHQGRTRAERVAGVQSHLKDPAEDRHARDLLAGAVVSLEYATAGIDNVAKWTGADCLPTTDGVSDSVTPREILATMGPASDGDRIADEAVTVNEILRARSKGESA